MVSAKFARYLPNKRMSSILPHDSLPNSEDAWATALLAPRSLDRVVCTLWLHENAFLLWSWSCKNQNCKTNFALVFCSNFAISLRNTPTKRCHSNFLGSDKKKLEMDSKISFFPMVWLSSQSLNSHVCIAWKIFYEKKVHLCNGPWFSKSVMMQIQMNAKFVGDIRKWEKPTHNTLKQK